MLSSCWSAIVIVVGSVLGSDFGWAAAESRERTVAPVMVDDNPVLFGIALVPPVGSESSNDVDKSGGIREHGTRTGSNDPGLFLS